LRVLGVVVVLSLLVAVPASADGDAARREGSCSGPGEWELRVSRESARSIRVRFEIEHVDAGDSWQLFLSDNGTRIFAGTRVADAEGELRVVKITANRAGRDLVKGSGVNTTAGGSCSGAIRY
jgi:hypothetical protein